MADETDNTTKGSRVSRRQLIKGGMVAGGVALWSAPMVAAARFGRFDRVRTISPQGFSVRTPGPTQSPSVSKSASSVVQVAPCEGYPPGTCVTFECGGSVTECGDGVTILGYNFRCFCDVDVDGNCFCGNDAPCALLPSCSDNSDCPPGWACIPSSCCSGTKCVAPCGTFPGLPFSLNDVKAEASRGINSGSAGSSGSTGGAGGTGGSGGDRASLERILAGGRMSGLKR